MKKLLILFLYLNIFFNSYLYAADIKINVDKNIINPGEVINLQILIENKTNNINPNLTNLEKKFIIISINKSQKIVSINNNIKESNIWDISLIPKNTNKKKIVIPAISFGNYSTKPIKIKIKKSTLTKNSTNKDIYIQTSISNKKPYINQATIYTLKIISNKPFENATLNIESLKKLNIIPLNKQKEYLKIVDNKKYSVIEQNFLLSFDKTGKININSPILRVGLLKNKKINFFSFNPFLNNIIYKNIIGPSINLEIQNIPNKFKKYSLFPASKVIINQKIANNSNHYKVGDIITQTITIKAYGIKASEIPELKYNEIQGMNIYADKIQNKNVLSSTGIIGIKKQKFILIPTKASIYQLPNFEIHWFNTKKATLEISRLKGKKIFVETIKNTINKKDSIDQNNKLNDIQNKSKKTNIFNKINLIWLLCFIFFVGWVVTLYALLRLRKKNYLNDLKKDTKKTISKKQYLAMILSHCKKNEAKQTKNLLISYLKLTNRDNNIINLFDFFDSNEIKDEIKKLNKAIYANSNNTWDGLVFWEVFNNYIKNKKTKKIKKNSLPKL